MRCAFATRRTIRRPRSTARSRASAGRCAVRLTDARFAGGKAPLVYAALGVAEGERFLPRAADCAPQLPLRLEMPEAAEPVLHICDAYGRQAFLRL